MKIVITESDAIVCGALSGRLDTAASAQFATDIEPLMQKADKKIVLDCSELEYISSSGLRIFLSLRKAAAAKGGSVTLKGVTSAVKQVFTITGFISLFNFE